MPSGQRIRGWIEPASGQQLPEAVAIKRTGELNHATDSAAWPVRLRGRALLPRLVQVAGFAAAEGRRSVRS